MSDRHLTAPAEGALPDGFTLSQSNLQMFVDCNRRFYLTHIERLPWPALEAAPYALHEAAMRDGDRFHRLVQRGIEGVPVERLPLAPPLDGWMAAWYAYGLKGVPDGYRSTERLLATTLHPAGVAAPETGWRMVAKYDLIAATQPNLDRRVVIVDWKTSATRPDVESVRRRLQSILYPFVLVEASPHLPFGPLAPEEVEMRYWYAGAPDAPIRLPYDSAQHAANRLLLQDLLADLLRRRGEEEFPKVPDTPANRRRFCNFCVYRSRCERGDVPGNLADDSEDASVEMGEVETAMESFAIESVTELAF